MSYNSGYGPRREIDPDILAYLVKRLLHRHDSDFGNLGLNLNLPLRSRVTDPIPPFIIKSNTKVQYLNADLWDGYHVGEEMPLTAESLRLPRIDTSSHLPAFGTTGRIIYVEDEDVAYLDIGTAWVVLAEEGAIDWNNILNKPSTFPPSAHQLDSATYHTVSGLTGGHFLKATGATSFGFAAHGLSYGDVGAAAASHVHAAGDITSGILDEAIGGLGKELDLTGLDDGYMVYYDEGNDKFIVDVAPTGGGAAGWENVVCYPWGGTAVLSADPLYDYTSEASDNTGSYVEAFYFDFDLPAGTVKSVFSNLIWAMKITGAGNGYSKWQVASGSHASPGTYYAFTNEHTEVLTAYQDHSRSGIIHKITDFPTTTPFVVRLVHKKGTATSVESKVKSNTYFRVTYKVS